MRLSSGGDWQRARLKIETEDRGSCAAFVIALPTPDGFGADRVVKRNRGIVRLVDFEEKSLCPHRRKCGNSMSEKRASKAKVPASRRNTDGQKFCFVSGATGDQQPALGFD